MFKVDDGTKLALARTALPELMASLAEAGDGEADADDMIDVLAICLAAILDNDSHIVTPKHVREGLETIGQHVKRRFQDLRAMRGDDGESFLAASLRCDPGAAN